MWKGGTVILFIFFFYHLNFACLKYLAAGLEVMGVSFRGKKMYIMYDPYACKMMSCEKDVQALMQRNSDWEAAEGGGGKATVGGCLGPKASV